LVGRAVAVPEEEDGSCARCLTGTCAPHEKESFVLNARW
jgi:hypothetical protein